VNDVVRETQALDGSVWRGTTLQQEHRPWFRRLGRGVGVHVAPTTFPTAIFGSP
jgi:hypothetical protein